MAKTILVVDDTEVNRRILCKLLGGDYNVLEAANGLEAMNVLMKEYQKIAAVLLDIVMPGLDGYGVLERMKENPALSQIPVIVTTGSAELEEEKKALALGANDFVAKPFDPDIVKRRLYNLIKLQETAAMVNALQRDKLTGLWNRETFFQKAEWEIKRKPEGYYLLSSLDIDNFKVINEQLGTERGDLVLKRLAKMIKEDCDANGGLCGRISADNFAVLYVKSNVKNSAMERREGEIEMIKNLNMAVTLSLGRYIVDDKTLSVSAMFDRANIARDTVKGRYDEHIAVYNETMRSGLVREHEIVNAMNGALASGQFEAWFQPQYNHATGALLGAEALARWIDPERGMISPAEFIPVFERNGFVYELDKFIWKSVCARLRNWMDKGASPLPVSVNISRYDLYRDDLVEVIAGLVEEFRLPEELLRLEITETAFADSTGQVAEVVKRLIDRGFTVEIDDFGSGYSSLNTLKDVPAQILKIDMRFLEKTDNLDRGGNILESVVRMAKWLGMSVIAEGVETTEQADFLKSIGCSYVQGYLYAKPMPADEYEALALNSDREERPVALETVENLDDSSFWNPESMDTLIFNSFVGAACIFEFIGTKLELVRITDKFAKMVGGAGLEAGDLLKLDWSAYLAESCRGRMSEAVRESAETNDDVSAEFMFLKLPGCPEKTYIRASVRVIAAAGERRLVYAVIENITAQREAEEKEREVASRLETIVGNVANGVMAVAVNEDGSVQPLLVSERYYALLGYTREQLTAEVSDLFEPISRDDIEVVRARYNEINRTGNPVSLEFRAVRRDGAEIWLRADISMISLAGEPRPVQLSVFTDITELRETTDRLRVLTENIPGGIASYVASPDGVEITYFNDGYCRILGYTREEYAKICETGVTNLVYKDDLPLIMSQINGLVSDGAPIRCVYRVLNRDKEGCKWMNLQGTLTERRGDRCYYSVVLTDVTELQEAMERLRVSEAEYRLAIEGSDRIIYRYNHADDSIDLPVNAAALLGLPGRLADVPESLISNGMVARESEEAYREFFRAIKRGDKSGSVTVRRRVANGSWRWFSVDFSNIFDENGRPISAIIVFCDVSDQLEKEAVYKRWQQSLKEKSPYEYTLFRCNLSRDTSFDTVEGSLLKIEFDPTEARAFNENTAEYAERFVYPDDREAYIETLNSDALLASYYRGTRSKMLEYRELLENGLVRWLRVSVDLVEYPSSTEVEAYLMYEDIDDAKREALLVREQAEMDPLTGVYNRLTFAEKAESLCRAVAPGSLCALLMLDIDGFKGLNDTFGHAAGDDALISIAQGIQSVLRPDDLLGRLGGDEFIVCLKDMTSDADIENKAMQISRMLRKSYSTQVLITASVGIAVCPRDGCDFDTLYRKADAALYAVKESGKDGFILYEEDIDLSGARNELEESPDERPVVAVRENKRRMLIVEDSRMDAAYLSALFEEEFDVEKVYDGASALVRLRHYGSAISVVLLDLIMPAMDGFDVLEKMRESAELQTIPVIVVSGSDDRETDLKVIEYGAIDFVPKPIDPKLIRSRVRSAVSRAENERLRAQNSLLTLQRDEARRYRAVLESMGTVTVENDWQNGTYVYDPSISFYLAGCYNNRRLWRIFLSDFVADAKDVKAMQDLVYEIANDRALMTGSVNVRLKTPPGAKHNFRMKVIKLANEFGLPDKIIMTFNDLDLEAGRV